MKPRAALVTSSALVVIAPLAILMTQSPQPRGFLLVRPSNVTHLLDAPTASSGTQQAPAQDGHQRNQPKGRHTITVIDASSKAPVVKANVTVKLTNVSNNSKCASHWEGRTDAKGGFAFVCDMPNGSARTHISIEAAGYWTLDDEFFLAEDRVLQLQKGD